LGIFTIGKAGEIDYRPKFWKPFHNHNVELAWEELLLLLSQETSLSSDGGAILPLQQLSPHHAMFSSIQTNKMEAQHFVICLFI
jgi:hypothetical protein